MKYIMYVLSLVLVISSCTSQTVPENSDGTIPENPTSEEDTQTEENDYIGLTEQEAVELAKEKGEIFRVVIRDNEPLMATMDYRPGRINANVEDGIVVDYSIEG